MDMPELGAPPPPDESEMFDGPVPGRPTQEEIDKAVALPGENVFPIRPPLFAGKTPIEEIGQTEPQVLARQPDDPGVTDQTRYLKTISLALDVLSARLMVLIAMLGGLAIWGVAIVAPSELRLIAAAGFSALVILPAVALHARKG